MIEIFFQLFGVGKSDFLPNFYWLLILPSNELFAWMSYLDEDVCVLFFSSRSTTSSLFSSGNLLRYFFVNMSRSSQLAGMNVTTHSSCSLIAFATLVYCCVSKMRDKPSWQPLNASSVSSEDCFLISFEHAQSSIVIRVLLPALSSLTAARNSSIWLLGQSMG